MAINQPRPMFITLKSLWDELNASRGETVEQFLDGLIFRERGFRQYPDKTVDAIYYEPHLLKCDDCGVTELDAIITSGLCEECLCKAEMEAEAEEAHVDSLRRRYFGSVL